MPAYNMHNDGEHGDKSPCDLRKQFHLAGLLIQKILIAEER